MSRLVRWGCAALGLVLALALALWPESPPSDVMTVSDTLFVRTEAVAPPQDLAQWTPRRLPDSWRQSNPGAHGYGWYRMEFVLNAAPVDAWGVYLSSVSTTYQLFINGIEVGNGGGMTGDIRRLAGKPQFDPVPPHILQAGKNDMLLRLRVGSNLRGGLGPLSIGARETVESLYDRAFFTRVTLSRSVNMALLFCGLLVLLLWLRRPQESLYGYFAGLAVLWSIRNFHYTMAFDLLPTLLWEAFVLGSLGGVLLLLWRFLLRLSGRRQPQLERWLSWGFLLAPVLFLCLGEQLLSQIRVAWYLLCAGMGGLSIYTLLQYLQTPQGRNHTGGWVVLVALAVTLVLGLSDLAVSAGWLPFGPSARMAFGAPLLLSALVYAVAENYFRTFDEVRTLNAELEHRVGERTLALEQAHTRMLQLERATAVADERERLMRDMHDGVGSQLMTTLSAVERGDLAAGEVAGLLRDSIADLRLVIDSLDPGAHSLNLALANLRYRMAPQLAALGIRLEWQVQEVVAPTAPETVLQILRIVQEAMGNAVKHSGASVLQVQAQMRGGALVIEISDNGSGWRTDASDGAPEAAHRGLGNMQLRARQMGARLDVRSAPGATTVVLTVPGLATDSVGQDCHEILRKE